MFLYEFKINVGLKHFYASSPPNASLLNSPTALITAFSILISHLNNSLHASAKMLAQTHSDCSFSVDANLEMLAN